MAMCFGATKTNKHECNGEHKCYTGPVHDTLQSYKYSASDDHELVFQNRAASNYEIHNNKIRKVRGT